MDAFTAKSSEIRRLHAVCRAKDHMVRQAYRREIRNARKMNHEIVRQALLNGRACGDDDRRSIRRELRDEYIHAARVLRDVLKEMEG